MITVYGEPEEFEADIERIGVSIRDVCLEAGVSHTTFYRWKNARTKPTVDVLVRLAKAVQDLEKAA